MAKFQYGDKFIQKLKKVEEGKKQQKPQKSESFSFGDILQDPNNLDDKNKLSLKKNPSGFSFRSAFSQSSFGDERSGNLETENEYYSKSQTGAYSNKYENDDSLESIEDQENIKFSPGFNKSNRDISGNLTEGMAHTYDPFDKEKMNYKNLI